MLWGRGERFSGFVEAKTKLGFDPAAASFALWLCFTSAIAPQVVL
jgi:hypothetical protein